MVQGLLHVVASFAVSKTAISAPPVLAQVINRPAAVEALVILFIAFRLARRFPNDRLASVLLELLLCEVRLVAFPTFEFVSIFHIVCVTGKSLSSWKDPGSVTTLALVLLRH